MAQAAALAARAMLALALTSLSGAATAARVEPVVPCFVTSAAGTAVHLRTDCGYVVVSQDPLATDGSEVKLGFLRLAARSAKDATPPQTRAEPLFMLAGGPGGSLIQAEVFA